MRKKLNLISIFLFFFFVILFWIAGTNYIEAKSYTIENMDIEATVQKNGTVSIKQTLTYHFSGSYNGIYITIPYQSTPITEEEVSLHSIIPDNLYNATNVDHISVSEILDSNSLKNYLKVSFASIGDNHVYKVQKDSSIFKIQVFAPANNTKKTFQIQYDLTNLCVKHKDVGELYYNFIGGKWDTDIQNLNIDVFLPENNSELMVWGHGPSQGTSKIVNQNQVNFSIRDVKKGQYVAGRVLFDLSNISDSTKTSNLVAQNIILEDEEAVLHHQRQKDQFTFAVVIFAIVLLFYWLILLWIFERDKKYPISNLDPEKLFQKYNPMVAGCIQGGRDILARDLIAVILNLIEKKQILLELIPTATGKENYLYMIQKNPETEILLDPSERYVYDWIFGGKEKINLNDRLKEISKEAKANQKFKELNHIVETQVYEANANKKTPTILRVFNWFVFVIAVIVILRHIAFNGVELFDSGLLEFTVTLIPYIFVLFPIILLLFYLPLQLIISLRHKINKTIQRFTGKRLVTTTVAILLIFAVIITLTAFLADDKYLIADELLLCIATILVLTDNLMLKNKVTAIEDFSKLNALKDYIEEYSLLEEKDVEQVTLWGKYLAYAVSFGVSEKIIKRIKELHLDDDIEGLLNNEFFSNVLSSGFSDFYLYASLDRRFLKSYRSGMGKLITSYGSSSSGGHSRGSGGGFSGGGRFFWWWRSPVDGGGAF